MLYHCVFNVVSLFFQVCFICRCFRKQLGMSQMRQFKFSVEWVTWWWVYFRGIILDELITHHGKCYLVQSECSPVSHHDECYLVPSERTTVTHRGKSSLVPSECSTVTHHGKCSLVPFECSAVTHRGKCSFVPLVFNSYLSWYGPDIDLCYYWRWTPMG